MTMQYLSDQQYKPRGVLPAFFIDKQLREWVPHLLQQQLGNRRWHKHHWVLPGKCSSSFITRGDLQSAVNRQQRSKGAVWEAICLECLARLRVTRITSSGSNNKAKHYACVRENVSGEEIYCHHLRTELPNTAQSPSSGNGGVIDEYQGSASCWKCNLLVKFTLALPIIKPKAVDLLIATRNDIVQKDIKGSKGQLLDTLMLTHTIIKKAINGKAEPVLDKRERVKKLLKFDNAFVQLITSVGFVAGSKTEDDVIVLDGTPNTIKAYYPPAVVSKIPPHGAGGLDAVVEDLAYTRLLGAVDELSILIGALQQNVDAGLRDAVYKVSEQAPSLKQILDADNYQRLTIERTRTLNAIIRKSEMEQAVLDFSYRALGIPEDVADLIVGWAYERLLQVDTSDDPVHGPEIQRRFDSLRCISAVRESTRLGEIINFEIERGLDPANSLTSAANALLGDHGVGLEDAVGQTHVSITKDLFAVALHRLYAKDEQIRLANKLIKLANHTLNDQELFRQAVDVRLAIESQTGHPATPAKLSSPDIMGSVERRRMDTTAVKSTLPVGLKNIGNTCYLNCMLQCLFSIKPIRDAVLKLGDKATWNEDRKLGRKDGRHLLTLEDIDNGLLLVGKLKNLFQSLIDKRIGCEPDEQFAADADVAPDNQLVNMLLYPNASPPPSSKNTLLGGSSTTTTGSSVPPPLPPRHNVSTISNMQQDVDECMSRCIELLVYALPPDEQSQMEGIAEPDPSSSLSSPSGLDSPPEVGGTWIHKLLFGMLESTQSTLPMIQTPAVQRTTLKTEQFRNINVNIPHPISDINECIDRFFAPIKLPSDGDDQKDEKFEFVRIKQAPPILFVQVHRGQYDQATCRSYKDSSHIRLRKQISLKHNTRFNGPSEWKGSVLQSSVRELEAHLKAIETDLPQPIRCNLPPRKDSLPIVQALEHAQAVIGCIGQWADSPDIKNALRHLSTDSHSAVADVSSTMATIGGQLSQLSGTLSGAKRKWESDQQTARRELETVYENSEVDDMTYILHAVFIHSGESTEGGHYWVYIRDEASDTDKGAGWLKFDDSNVSVVQDDEVFLDTPKNDLLFANPYYLVYVKADNKSAVGF